VLTPRIRLLSPGCTPFTYQELRGFLADRLAAYEIPVAMEIPGSLPKTPAGKLSKKELAAQEKANREKATG
jgi:long-chain acyl-CoA synthetase